MPRRGDDDFGPTGYQLAVPRLTPVVRWVLIAMGALLVLELIDFNWLGPGKNVAQYLALSPRSVLRLELWRLVSYPLLLVVPGGMDALGPLFWGALVLWMFGGPLEEALGGSRFLLFVGACVLAPAIIAVGVAAFHPVFFTQPIYGTEPLSLALTAAWGTRFPRQKLFFPPVSGRTLVLALIGLQLIYVLMRAPQESVAISLSSIATGFLLMRYWDHIDDWLDRLRQRRVRRRRAKGLAVIRGGRDPKIDKRFLN